MSRRTLAPLLLLVAAALAVGAVFAVHRIEAAGGPLSEPWSTLWFSPNGDGERDSARVSFTTRRPERVSVVMRDAGGETVRHLTHDRRVDGRVRVPWDGRDDAGRRVPDGRYRAVITRAGDDRAYSPARDTMVDTRPPAARLDRGMVVRGSLGALVLVEPAARIRATVDGVPLQEVRAFRPRDPDAASARPRGGVPAGTEPLRVIVRLGPVALPRLRLVAVDLAGNRTDLLDDAARARVETTS